MDKKKKVFFRIFIVLFIFNLNGKLNVFALDIYIAPLVYSDDRIQDPVLLREKAKEVSSQLVHDLKRQPVGGEVKFRELFSEGGGPPTNLLEAIRITENRKIEYLLYGTIMVTEKACYVELRLVSGEAKQIVQYFYGSDNAERIARCITESAEKVVSYFRETLGYRPMEEGLPAQSNVWIFSGKAGYMMPYLAPWNDYLYGIGTVGFDAMVLPKYPNFVLDGGDVGIGMQFGIIYALAKNREQYENAYLHWFSINSGVELMWTQFRNVEITFATGLRYNIALLFISPNYADSLSIISAVPGAYVCTGLSYTFTEHSSIGLGIMLDLNLHEPVSGFCYPVIRYSYSLEALHEK